MPNRQEERSLETDRELYDRVLTERDALASELTTFREELEQERRARLHVPYLEKGEAALRVSLDPETFVYGTPEAIKIAQAKLGGANRYREALERTKAALYAADDDIIEPALHPEDSDA